MTVPCISYTSLVKDHLEPNGYNVEAPQAQDFWNVHDRIMVRKGDFSFPLQFREKYFYLQVVHLFRQLEIPIPEEHQRCYDLHMAHHEKQKKAESLKNKEEGGQ